ncbi:class I SAM-dependent methyltransferase [Marimonas arenosa]|nr:class I SAM-dependent methyltransferase [Marimonas arenosa]
MAAFFRLHRGLPREGPGCDSDVAWAVEQAGLRDFKRVLDAGSGPGGDVAALRAVAPEAEIVAIDNHTPFIDDLKTRFSDDAGVIGYVGDMMAAQGPFELIWCAGAIYFVGVTEALAGWRDALASGGAVAFSQACLFRPDPPAAVDALFEGYPVTDVAGIAAQVAAAGYELLAARPVSDAAWEAYYQPMEARIAALRPGADAALTQVLDEADREIATWRAHARDFGYLLCVARPR